MAITLNHTIVPAHDKEASVQFFARIFGLTYAGPVGHFAPVQVNDTLTLRLRHPRRVREPPLRVSRQRCRICLDLRPDQDRRHPVWKRAPCP